MSARFSLIASLVAVALGASSAAQAQYTIKLGGAYFDTNATSRPLEGQLPAVNPATGQYLGNVNVTNGPSLEVQNRGTFVFSIERALTDRWSVEFLLGNPPKHDVKLRTGSPVLTATPTLAGGSALGQAQAIALTRQKLVNNDGVVVSTVRQWAPTLFANYKFLDESSSVRPFIGVGINVTRFKARTNAAGDKVYNDGKPYVKLSDSIGPALQAGLIYKIDEHWALQGAVATAQVKNKLIIETNHSRQETSFRFNPTVYSAQLAYTF